MSAAVFKWIYAKSKKANINDKLISGAKSPNTADD